jgi:hypothetical protein
VTVTFQDPLGKHLHFDRPVFGGDTVRVHRSGWSLHGDGDTGGGSHQQEHPNDSRSPPPRHSSVDTVVGLLHPQSRRFLRLRRHHHREKGQLRPTSQPSTEGQVQVRSTPHVVEQTGFVLRGLGDAVRSVEVLQEQTQRYRRGSHLSSIKKGKHPITRLGVLTCWRFKDAA